MRRTGMAVAYFYFDFTDKEKQLPEKMIRSILKQLSVQCPETPYVMLMLQSSCEETDRPPSIDELLDTMQKIMRSFCDIYIVLDALDECLEREELMEYLEIMASWNLDHLHILASSRPERAIEEGIGHLIKSDSKIKVQSDLISDDIRKYISVRLLEDTKLKRWQNKLDVQQEIESCLMDKAKGM
jgi:hypothetical protein